ncbi:MAG: hypothetical protein ACLP7O_00985 [Terracidiphilus sp.]
MGDQVRAKSPLEAEQYKQACDDHRFFGDMRFKQLSLFAVMNGLLLNALNSSNAVAKASTIGSLGMMISAVIWIMEVRSSIFGHRARAKKKSFELETEKIPSGLEDSPIEKCEEQFEIKWTHVNATNAVLSLYMISYLSWLVLFFWEAHSWILQAFGLLMGLMFVFLVIFTMREYLSLLRHGHRNWKW